MDFTVVGAGARVGAGASPSNAAPAPASAPPKRVGSSGSGSDSLKISHFRLRIADGSLAQAFFTLVRILEKWDVAEQSSKIESRCEATNPAH